MKMKVRGRFWVLRTEPYLYLFDNEKDAINGVIELWQKGIGESIKDEDLHIIEITSNSYRVRPFDWKKVAIQAIGREALEARLG